MERFRAFWRSSTAALSERDFRLLWIGQTGSFLGDALVGVALAFAVLELTGSAADLGLVFAAFALPRVLFTLAGGVWSDRLPRQRVMVACDLIRAAAQAVMSTLLITGNAQIWQLMAFAVVMGSAAAFFTPASIGLMPQIVGAKRLQEANALMSISQSATHIFGPLLSGLIVATIGAGWAFAIDGASFLVSAGFLVAMRIPLSAPAPRRTFVSELADGWHEVVSRSVGGGLHPDLLDLERVAGRVPGARAAGRQPGDGRRRGVGHDRRRRVDRRGGRRSGGAALEAGPAPDPRLPGHAAGADRAAAAGASLPGADRGDGRIRHHRLDRHQQHAVGHHAAAAHPARRLSRVSSYDWMVSLVFQPLAFAAVGPVSEQFGVEQTLVVCTALGLVANSVVLLVPSVRNLRRVDQSVAEESIGAAAGAGDPTEPPVATST